MTCKLSAFHCNVTTTECKFSFEVCEQRCWKGNDASCLMHLTTSEARGWVSLFTQSRSASLLLIEGQLCCLQHKEEYRNALFSRWFVGLVAWNEEIMRDPAVVPPASGFWANILVRLPALSTCPTTVQLHRMLILTLIHCR